MTNALSTRRLLLAALVCLLAGGATAQEPTPYRVEVVVLEHTNPFAAGERFAPDDRRFTDATAAYGDTTTDTGAPPPPVVRPVGRFEPLAAADFALTEVVTRLTNASRFRVLGHFGWTQAAPPTDEALAFAVSSALTDGRVKGTIVLSRSRFLRLDVDLTFTDGEVIVDLNQARRRVQTGQLHYLDHPYFGIILQVLRDTES